MLEILNFRIIIAVIAVLLGISYAPSTHIDAHVVPKLPKYIKQVDAKQIHCMAKNIVYEAGGESFKGQVAVARVVVNRVAHGFAKTPCGVIYQATTVNDTKICQFSWVCEGKGEPNKNSQQYKVAHQIAYEVLVHNKYNDVIPKSVLFFHNMSVSPLWPYAEALRIGNHIFYSKYKKKNTVKPEKKVLQADAT